MELVINEHTATKDLILNLGNPQTPWPLIKKFVKYLFAKNFKNNKYLVHPFPNLVPNPVKNPAKANPATLIPLLKVSKLSKNLLLSIKKYIN